MDAVMRKARADAGFVSVNDDAGGCWWLAENWGIRKQPLAV